MTNPNPVNSVGDVYADLHVRGGNAPKEMKEALERAGKENDDTVEDIGRDHGRKYAEEFSKSSETHLRNVFGDQLSSVLGDIGDDVRRTRGGGRGVDIFDDADVERRARRTATSWFSGFRNAITGLFDREGGSIFTRFGQLFQSTLGGPIGAFFNVSGRSPLLVVLIPLLGYIISLVTALIYGLQAAISFLYLVPSLLFAVGLQASALFFIFSGFGDALTAAFAATNAEELAEALSKVRPEVAEVIKALLPLKDFFKVLKDSAQFTFFDVLDANKITAVLDRIQGPFGQAIVNIAGAFGNVANSLLDVFASPEFGKLIQTLGDSTVQWLNGFGPALASFIDGLNHLGNAIDPFLDWFGQEFNKTIDNWGKWLESLGQDPKFLKWLEDSKVILGDFMDLLGMLLQGVVVFIQQFIEADKRIKDETGHSFLESLYEMTKVFVAFLSSPITQDALVLFIRILELLVGGFYGLVIAIIFVMGWLETVGEGIVLIAGDIGTAVGALFSAIGTRAQEVLRTVVDGIPRLIEFIGHFFNALGIAAHDKWEEIKRGVGDFFDQLGTNFYFAGVNVVARFIAGINSMMGPLGNQMNAMGKVASSRMPHSPAEEGPLSGRGDPLLAGKELVNRFATGIELQAPSLSRAMNSATSNVTFDPGAVQVNYYGNTPPSQSQMQAMGNAAGQGIVGQMNATRLAVRTI